MIGIGMDMIDRARNLLYLLFDEPEHDEYEECQYGRYDGDTRHPETGRHADACGHPNAGRCRDAGQFRVFENNEACAQEAYAGNYLRDDERRAESGNAGISSDKPFGDGDEERRTHRNERIRAHAGSLVREDAFNADDHAEEHREREIGNHFGVLSKKLFHRK